MCPELLSLLHKIDTTLLESLDKHDAQLNAGDFESVKLVLMKEEPIDREWRKAIFRLFDARLLDLGFEIAQEDSRLRMKLFPFATFYGEIIAKKVAMRRSIGGNIERASEVVSNVSACFAEMGGLPCLQRARELGVHLIADAFKLWDFSDTFADEVVAILETAENPSRQKLSVFLNCVKIADRYDASRTIVTCLNNPDTRQTILDLPDQEFGDALSLIQSLIDDNTEYSAPLKRLLFDLVKERPYLPNSLVVKGVSKAREASVCAGGMADIYHVRREESGDILALKVQRGVHLQKTRNSYARYVYTEALVWRQLKHDNILPLIGIVFDIPYTSSVGLLAPWMRNGSLDTYLTKNEHVDRLSIITQIASALCYLHAQQPPIIHGDLRAGNILVDDLGHPVIADFGISKMRTIQTIVHTGDGIGTLRWQAPELHEGTDNKGHTSKASDVYAFGMTCLEVFTDEVPFPKYNKKALIQAILDGRNPERPVSKAVFARGLNADVWSLLCKCWSKYPRTRPSMADIHPQLETIVGSADNEEVEVAISSVDVDVLPDVYETSKIGSDDGLSGIDSILDESPRKPGYLKETLSGMDIVLPQSAPASPTAERTFMLCRSSPNFFNTSSSLKSTPIIPTRASIALLPPPKHPRRLAPGWEPITEDGKTHYWNRALHLDTLIRPSAQPSKSEFSLGDNSGRSSFEKSSVRETSRSLSKNRTFENLPGRSRANLRERTDKQRDLSSPPPLPPRRGRSASPLPKPEHDQDITSDSIELTTSTLSSIPLAPTMSHQTSYSSSYLPVTPQSEESGPVLSSIYQTSSTNFKDFFDSQNLKESIKSRWGNLFHRC